MKKLLIFILLVSTTVISFGQELKTKKKKVDMQEGTATFYVLAGNDTVKQGDYQIKAYTGSRILLKGKYDKNQKTGLWEEQYYGKEYKGPKAIGHYENNQKVGKWTYFNYNGDTAQIYDWTENKLIFFKLCGTDNKEYTIIENGKESITKLDCPPTCVSGPSYFLYEFQKKIGLEADYFKNVGNELYQLKTKITITIDENSSVTDITYSTEEKKELKEIIEKFIKTFKWIAGKKERKDVTSKFEFSINLSSQY